MRCNDNGNSYGNGPGYACLRFGLVHGNDNSGGGAVESQSGRLRQKRLGPGLDNSEPTLGLAGYLC